MKILAIGSVPPPRTGHQQSLLDAVLGLRAEGHEVRVMSPDPLSAAHGFLIGSGLPGAAEAGLLARRAEAVVIQIERGFPVRPTAGRLERSLALLTLAAMLRGHGDVTLRLHHLDDLPGGPGGRPALELWKTARRIEVGDAVIAERLGRLLPELSGRLTVVARREPPAAISAHAEAGGECWGAGADITADQVQALVRQRAAQARGVLATRRHACQSTPQARVPLWEWLPAPGAGVPELGPQRRDRHGADGESTTTRRRSARQLGSAALAAAERRPLTRPAAQLTRVALAEIRGAVRR